MTTFDEFWQIARSIRGRLANPRKTAKAAWDKAVSSGTDPNLIYAGFLGYDSAMTQTNTDPAYCCMVATFINQERWEQYLNEPVAQEWLATRQRLRVVK